MSATLAVLRVVVAAAAGLAGVVALTHWAVRQGHLQPFGAFPRAVRSIGDPLLKPVEQRLLRSGGNPQQAPLWLFLGVLGGGLLLLALAGWILGAFERLWWAMGAGPWALIYVVVEMALNLLILTLLVRVVGSWFGVGRATPWMRPAYVLTDWLVEPIRKRMPPTGMFDWSPLVAWLILVLARAVLRA
jgi:YggT family protein